MSQDIHVQFENALETGNVKSISKIFDKQVEINLDGDIHNYSIQQAQVVLSEFLSRLVNPSYELLQKGISKTQSKYFIGMLTSGKIKYHVYLFLKKENGTDIIQQIKFEKLTS